MSAPLHANDLPVRSSAFPVALGQSLLICYPFLAPGAQESHFLLLFPIPLQVPPRYPLAGLLFSILLPRQLDDDLAFVLLLQNFVPQHCTEYDFLQVLSGPHFMPLTLLCLQHFLTVTFLILFGGSTAAAHNQSGCNAFTYDDFSNLL